MKIENINIGICHRRVQRGRNASTGEPMGKITNAIYSNETILSMIKDNTISIKKTK